MASSPRADPAWRGYRRIAGTFLAALGQERLRTRAMALTYLSLFALVPALVVAFSVVQAFTGMDAVWRAVHGFLLDNLAVGARSSIEPYLDRFVSNAHTASAGLVGGALLLYSAVTLFMSVEVALNEVWAVKRLRPLGQRALTYWAGLTLGPFFLAGSLALSDLIGGYLAGDLAGKLFARLAAVVLSCALFGLLYLLVPATRVEPKAALAGGVAAALAFELAKALYTYAVRRFFRYHAVYGSLAAVPIFLLWLYVSWSVVLLGARIAFVYQHARALLRGHAPEGEHTALGRELLAARALLAVALAFHERRAPPDPAEVALRLSTFVEPTREVLGLLRRQGLVVEVNGGGLVPARPLAQLTLADVRRAVSGEPVESGASAADALVAALLAEAEGSAAAALAGRSYADICGAVALTAPPAAAARTG